MMRIGIASWSKNPLTTPIVAMPPQGWTDRKQLETCAETVTLSWVSQQGKTQYCYRFSSLEKVCLYPLFLHDMPAPLHTWDDIYQEAQRRKQQQAKQKGPQTKAEAASLQLVVTMKNVAFIPLLTLPHVNRLFMGGFVAQGVRWHDMRLPHLKEYHIQNAGLIWCLPYDAALGHSTEATMFFTRLPTFTHKINLNMMALTMTGGKHRPIDNDRFFLGFVDGHSQKAHLDCFTPHPPPLHLTLLRQPVVASVEDAGKASPLNGADTDPSEDMPRINGADDEIVLDQEKAKDHKPPPPSTCTLLDLPPEVIQAFIMKPYLSCVDVMACKRTCRYLYGCVSPFAKTFSLSSPWLYDTDDYAQLIKDGPAVFRRAAPVGALLSHYPSLPITCAYVGDHGMSFLEHKMWIDIRHDKTDIFYDDIMELSTLTLCLRHEHAAQPFAEVQQLLISTYHRRHQFCYIYTPRNYFAGIIGACEHALRTYMDGAFNDLDKEKAKASAETSPEEAEEVIKEGTPSEHAQAPHNASGHASGQDNPSGRQAA
ncbi:hypothetical protein [Candidatus Hepatobacter penaei]|uniref:hypothetical protein n=1 Tax=Candidatus Hepatobacter penaei TaxID=1274402 RepID=UPI0012E0183F|nr:hypothetical protein [Candidatus Hepatobacter penaei]